MTFRRMMVRALLPLVTVLTAFGQSTTGTIVGTISDPSGSITPGAAVVVINEQTGARRDLLTNPAGQFAAPLLAVGTYRVEVQKSGFKSASMGGLVLEVNQTIR